MSAEDSRSVDADIVDEVDRLRALVGPSESSYGNLQDQLAAARVDGQRHDAELGALRAEITALRVDLHRAQQDQYHMRRLFLSPALAVRNRLQRRHTAADQE